jgi:hypothetical protein
MKKRGVFGQGGLKWRSHFFFGALIFFRFIYYFMNTTDEDTQALNAVLKGDMVNLGRLNRLRSKLRREAVSTARIARESFFFLCNFYFSEFVGRSDFFLRKFYEF